MKLKKLRLVVAYPFILFGILFGLIAKSIVDDDNFYIKILNDIGLSMHSFFKHPQI